MTTLTVIAAPGIAVPQPVAGRPPITTTDPANPAVVPDDAYWRRRVADGDLIVVEPTPAPAPAVVTEPEVEPAPEPEPEPTPEPAANDTEEH